MWLILCLAVAVLWTSVNFLDKFIIEKYGSVSSDVGPLVLFSALAGLPVSLAIGFLSDTYLAVPKTDAAFLILNGFLYLLAVVPYLYALSWSDTSSIVPQFLLVPVFSYFLAFIFLGESISTLHLLGSLMVLFGAYSLSKVGSKFFLKTFGLMSVSAFLLSLNTVIFKRVYTTSDIGFMDAMYWQHVGFVLFGIFSAIFVRHYIKSFLDQCVKGGVKVISINFSGEFVTMLGNFIFHYASLLTAVFLVEVAVESLQPVVGLFMGSVLTAKFPKYFSEKSSRSDILAKSLIIIFMLFGISTFFF